MLGCLLYVLNDLKLTFQFLGQPNPLKQTIKSIKVNKSVFLFTVLALLPALVASQISLRPQAGFNTSTLTRDLDEATFNSEVGFQFGLDLQVGERFYFQPGIFWESAKNELKERIDGDRTEFSVSRIRLPLMLGYRLLSDDTDGLLDVRLFTGPNAAFAVSKDLKETALLSKGDFKDAVFGWNVGLGVDLAIFFVDVGYMFGLSEVFEGAASDVRNNLFYANAGLRLGF